METGWKRIKIEDVGKVVGGATPSTNNTNYYNGDIAWITPKDLSGYKYRHISRGSRNITNEGLKNCSTQLMPEGSILFTSRAPIGYVAIAKNDICTNQGFKSIVPDKKIIDSMFLYYTLVSEIKSLKELGTGTTFPEISGKVLGNYSISIPSLHIQEIIGKFLSNIDDLIENNMKINDNLVEIAQELFIEQFGAMLLDDEPPAGWKKGRYDDIIIIHDSKRIPLSGNERENMNRIYPYYGAATVAGYVDNYIFDGVYLLFGEDGTVIDEKGNPSLQYVWGKFWVNNHAHILTGRNGFSVESLFLLSKQLKVESIITGAVQPKISQNSMKNVALNIPPEEKISSFNKKIVPIFNQYRNNYDENQRLSILRDALLPKLISGEIDVLNLDLGS